MVLLDGAPVFYTDGSAPCENYNEGLSGPLRHGSRFLHSANRSQAVLTTAGRTRAFLVLLDS